MSPVAKAITWIVVVAIAAVAGIGSQIAGRVSAEPVALSADEIGMLVEKQFRPMERAQLAGDPAARKEFLEQQVKPIVALAAEGQRLGIDKEEKTQVVLEVFEAQIIGQAYTQKHAQEFGPQGPQLPPEELERWKAAHGPELERITRVAKELSPQGGGVDPDEMAQLFILGERGRAEGLQNDPFTALQLKLSRLSALAQSTQDRISKETAVTDQDVTEYYNARAARGDLDQLHVAHILVSTKPTAPGAPARSDDEAKQKAQELLQRVRGGEDFAKLAQENSDDPGSKNNGGEYTAQQFEGFVKEFKDAAYKLQPGEVSEPVKSDFGYHIIKLIDRQPPQQLTPQYQQQLKQRLTAERQQDRIKEIQNRGGYSLPDDFAVAMPEQMPQPQMMPPGMGAPDGGEFELPEEGDDMQGQPAPGAGASAPQTKAAPGKSKAAGKK